MDAAHKLAATVLMGVSLAGLTYIGFAFVDIYTRHKAWKAKQKDIVDSAKN